MNRGQEKVGAVAEDGEEEGGGQSMTEQRRESDPRGGEPLDRREGRLSFREPLDEVGSSGDRGGEPVAQPPNLGFGCENRPIEVDRSAGDVISIPVRARVDELRLGY